MRLDNPDPGGITTSAAAMIPSPCPLERLRIYSTIRCCCCCSLGAVTGAVAAHAVVVEVVGVAVPVREVKRQERHGCHGAGEQEHRVEPPLVEAEPTVSIVRC